MKNSPPFLYFILVCLICMGCFNSQQSKQISHQETLFVPSRSLEYPTSNDIYILESMNKFGIKLFKEIEKNTPAGENIFISPLSVSFALGLCNNGADGATRRAIMSTLETTGLKIKKLNRAYQDLTKMLINHDSLIRFNFASSFWSRQDKAIEADFIKLASNYFKARVEEIDFQSPDAVNTINSWASIATNGKITKMIEPPIDPDIASIIMNAIYFDGDWMFPFDTTYTRDAEFTLYDGSKTTCQMMWLREEDHSIQIENQSWATPDQNLTGFNHFDYSAVSLPYGRGDFRMTIIVTNNYPGRPKLSVEDIIDALSWESWIEWLNWLRPTDFSVGLPKLRFAVETNLTGILKELGMEIAFDQSKADFGNMFVDKKGWLSKVLQKAFVQVDERGTEATAVTEIVTSDSISEIIANKPFLFVIHEESSGAILFIGKIANPVWVE